MVLILNFQIPNHNLKNFYFQHLKQHVSKLKEQMMAKREK